MLSLETLESLLAAHRDAAAAPVRAFDLKGRRFDPAEGPAMMGVVNLSADSWYRESVCLSAEHAITRGKQLALDGAALIDIGAESTLPQAALVGAGDQKSQLLPVVEALAADGILCSVETYHAEVAEAALSRGAAVINLTGQTGSDAIYETVARHQAGVIICYVAGETVREVTELPAPEAIVELQLAYFREQVAKAEAAGVRRIWIDGGLGFYYKNSLDGQARIRYQLQVFLNSFRYHVLGWPVCHALPHAFPLFREEVRSAEAFFAVMAVLGKASLLRTHEVAKVRPVIDTLKLA